MRDVHVDPDLSAYLDDELVPADRARVEAHLGTCDMCARRLAELRATASLITALPYARASRSLVPRVAERWTWLRPVRSLSMVASGAFLFVFLLTAVARSGTGLGGAGAPTAAQPAAAPLSSAAPFGAFATAAASTRSDAAATAAPAPAVGAAASDSAAQRAPVPAPTSTPQPQKAVQGTSGVAASGPSAALEAQRDNVPLHPDQQFARGAPAPNPLLEPLLWLLLAIVAAVLALIAHARLRAS